MSAMPFVILSDADLISHEERRALRIHRAKRYAELYKNKTLEEIAVTEGISRERVRQLLKEIGVTRLEGGMHLRSLSKSALAAAVRVRRRDQDCLKWYGCSYEQYCQLSGAIRLYTKCTSPGRGILSRFWTHRYNAERNGIEWKFTLPEYCEFVGERSAEFGRGAMHLARIDKRGPFSKDNCEIIDNSENSSRTRALENKENVSRKELDAARMRAAGMGHADIGRVLGISTSTVKCYLYRLQNRQRTLKVT